MVLPGQPALRLGGHGDHHQRAGLPVSQVHRNRPAEKLVHAGPHPAAARAADYDHFGVQNFGEPGQGVPDTGPAPET
jgi:hypothetical protein